MKYLCMIYIDERKLAALPSSEFDAIVNECLDYSEQLKASGHYIGGNALESVQSATTLRHQGGRVTMTDGPFAETKEQLGGFYMIEARDLNEALQIAAKIPPGRLGSIEVRPIREPDARPAFATLEAAS
ncbi:YciI family protein [Metapseudomonas boanensis]|uniref:YciI family protein n=1 Tax=Metapseudomonas boanensis TaxID=2822138 RepID=A0ABS5XHN8_9GAMM|nr:YciI family protein [Pseudomonas boanensis]MBT8766671.1 YciI family protein [Pseudomonas boanensis]